jgi:GAF domain-containing protein
MEFWSVVWFGIALIAGGMYLRLRRGHQTLAEKMQTLSTELGQVDAKYTLDRAQMDFLCDFAQNFDGEISSTESINITIETLWQLPEVAIAAILLGENELGPFHYMGIRGVDNPLGYMSQTCPLPLWGVLAYALVHRTEVGEVDCVAIDDIQAGEKPQIEEFPWLPAQGSLLILPLRGRGNTIGAAVLYAKQPGAFRSMDRQRFLYVLGSYISRSLHEARTHDQSLRWARHLVSLQLLTRTMSSAKSIESIQDILCEECQDLFGTIAVHLFLQSAEGTTVGDAPLRLFAGVHISQSEEQFVHSPNLRQLLAWVMEAEQPLFVEPQAALLRSHDLYYQESGHSVLVPILGINDRAGGVLILVTPTEARPFDENDLIVIRTIANSASVAISNRQHSDAPQIIPA